MFKLPFLSKEEEKKILDISPDSSLLAIDIGTEMLKVLRFTMDELSVKVKQVSHIRQQSHAMHKGKVENLDTILENCRLAISEVTSDLSIEQKPEYAVLGIAGEYIQGISIQVNYERIEKHEEEVTEDEEKEIIEEVHSQIQESGKEDLSRRTGLEKEDIEILHITVTGMKIGGMNVKSLQGYRGKDVKLYFYASFAPKTYVESLKRLIKDLDLNLLGIVAQPFAVARAYSGGREKDFSAIFIDIGGGTTDVAVVKNGNVADTQMFGFGGRVFTKEIAKIMNLDYRHAEMRKIKYGNGELERNVHNEIKNITYPTAELWMKTLYNTLDLMDDIDSFPTQVFLCGGGALLPDIKNVMMEFPWSKLLNFSSVPKVNIFLPERLNEIQDETSKLKHSYDITPSALARFAFDKVNNPENYYFDVQLEQEDD